MPITGGRSWADSSSSCGHQVARAHCPARRSRGDQQGDGRCCGVGAVWETHLSCRGRASAPSAPSPPALWPCDPPNSARCLCLGVGSASGFSAPGWGALPNSWLLAEVGVGLGACALPGRTEVREVLRRLPARTAAAGWPPTAPARERCQVLLRPWSP